MQVLNTLDLMPAGAEGVFLHKVSVQGYCHWRICLNSLGNLLNLDVYLNRISFFLLSFMGICPCLILLNACSGVSD